MSKIIQELKLKFSSIETKLELKRNYVNNLCIKETELLNENYDSYNLLERYSNGLNIYREELLKQLSINTRLEIDEVNEAVESNKFDPHKIKKRKKVFKSGFDKTWKLGIKKVINKEFKLSKIFSPSKLVEYQYFLGLNEVFNINNKLDPDETISAAILLASRKGSLKILKYLIEYDPNPTNLIHNAAFIIDSDNSSLEIVKYQTKLKTKKASIIFVCKPGYFQVVKYLVESDALNAKGSFLSSSILDDVKYYIEAKTFLNPKFTETAFLFASERGHSKIVKYLVDYVGIDINVTNSKKKTALMQASRNDVNAQDLFYSNTALNFASKKGELDLVIFLVERGADVNVKGEHGYTPLYGATLFGYFEIVKFLVEHGADVNEANFKNETALMLASQTGRLEIAKCLVEHGADVNAKDRQNETALMIASRRFDLEIAELLVKNGADVNAKDVNCKTALIKATKNVHLDMVKFLIENGADVNARDSENKTALMIASEKGHVKIVGFLLVYGAGLNENDNEGNKAMKLAFSNWNFRTFYYLVKNKIKTGL